jgi:hypothetical protein
MKHWGIVGIASCLLDHTGGISFPIVRPTVTVEFHSKGTGEDTIIVCTITNIQNLCGRVRFDRR